MCLYNNGILLFLSSALPTLLHRRKVGYGSNSFLCFHCLIMGVWFFSNVRYLFCQVSWYASNKTFLYHYSPNTRSKKHRRLRFTTWAFCRWVKGGREKKYWLYRIGNDCAESSIEESFLDPLHKVTILDKEVVWVQLLPYQWNTEVMGINRSCVCGMVNPSCKCLNCWNKIV